VIRDQQFLLPPDMAEWLPEDHLVWFVLEVVEQLDTEAFHADHALAGPGRAAYDPDMLLALLIYAYCVGERSSRRIEQLCGDHVAFRVLCAQDAPDHTTIARFRARHEAAFAGVFAQVLRLCAAAGMVKVGVVAIDGTKIAANASRGANRTATSVRQEAERLAADIVAQASAVDAAEDAEERAGGNPAGRLGGDLGDRPGRAATIARALAELDRQDREFQHQDAEDAARAEAFLARIEAGEAPPGKPPAGVDPVRFHRARLVRYQRQVEETTDAKVRRHAREGARKAQAALVEAEQQAAAGGVDLRGLAARRRDRRDRKRRARGGADRSVNLTDPDSRLMIDAAGGSVQGYNAQIAVSDDHFILARQLSQDPNDAHCFAPMLTALQTTLTDLDLEVGTVLADAGYFTDHNLTTEGPDRLIAPGKHKDLARAVRDDPADGPPPEDADAKEQMRHRLRAPEAHQLYQRRSATVEPVNAHLKDQIRLRRFARRGLTAATAELDLAVTAVNIRRWHATQSTHG
jgi:transposase